MRRRKQSDQSELLPNTMNSPSTSFPSQSQWSTIGILAALLIATLFNGHMYMRHTRNIASPDQVRVGDFVVVKLPILSGSHHTEERLCSGRILSSNVSSCLVLITGHALEGAQWISREKVSANPDLSSSQDSHICSLSNSVVSPVAITKKYQSADRCSRFLHRFCSKEWEQHPKTRHFSSFECLYPSISKGGDLSLSAWYIAQSIGKSNGLCPEPSVVLWPPSKLTYPTCSDAISQSSRENKRVLAAHFSFPHKQDALYRLQEGAYSVGHCPSPDLFRWAPDAVLWPQCDRCIRDKCAPGAACHVDSSNKWASHRTQHGFADAQNWCAGRGKCPGSLEGRWRPGPLFYPNCSTEILGWCQRNGVVKECIDPPDNVNRIGSNVRNEVRIGVPQRVQAQQWAHDQSACPDPISEFMWHSDLI